MIEITLFDLHFGHIHPIASPPIKKHPELARMPIKLRYECGMNSLFYNTLPLKNGYKITELYYIIQALFLPVKRHPTPLDRAPLSLNNIFSFSLTASQADE